MRFHFNNEITEEEEDKIWDEIFSSLFMNDFSKAGGSAGEKENGSSKVVRRATLSDNACHS